MFFLVFSLSSTCFFPRLEEENLVLKNLTFFHLHSCSNKKISSKKPNLLPAHTVKPERQPVYVQQLTPKVQNLLPEWCSVLAAQEFLHITCNPQPANHCMAGYLIPSLLKVSLWEQTTALRIALIEIIRGCPISNDIVTHCLNMAVSEHTYE